MKRELRFLISILAVAAISSLPAAAAHEEGWYAWIEGYSTMANNLHHAYAATEHENSEDGEILMLDPDSEISTGVGFGWGWGEKGAIRVSYWTYDLEDSREDRITGYNSIDDSFLGNYTGYYYTPFDAEGTSEVDATSIEVEYVNHKDLTDMWTLGMVLGVRHVVFEDEMSFRVRGTGNRLRREDRDRDGGAPDRPSHPGGRRRLQLSVRGDGAGSLGGAGR
jgi:hypothetical protein